MNPELKPSSGPASLADHKPGSSSSMSDAIADSLAEAEFVVKSGSSQAPSMPDTAVGFTDLVPSQADSSSRFSLLIQNEISLLSPSSHPHSLGRLGEYEVSQVIGVGGMGVVFQAWDEKLGRWVAIKTMAPHVAFNPAARRRFVKEAKAAGSIRHPNVISIYSVSLDESIPYLVMPYLNGGSLQQALDRGESFSLPDLLKIGSQAAAGLAAAHRVGIVHRDIKPENILHEEGIDHFLLTDFGLARYLQEDSSNPSQARVGTPQYQSPEQVLGESLDPRSDLFSLGSVLYTLCTKQLPFQATPQCDIALRIIHDSPEPIQNFNPEIPEWFCSIVMKLMAKDKNQRFQTAAEVQQLLEKAQHQAPVNGRFSELSYPISRSKSLRYPLGVALGVGLVVTLGALLTAPWGELLLPVQVVLEEVPDSSTSVMTQPRDNSLSLTSPDRPMELDPDSSPPETPPPTWEQIFSKAGRSVPDNYPDWPLSLIQALDEIRGKKTFTGDIVHVNQTLELLGEVTVDGGFSGTAIQPQFVQWNIQITWSEEGTEHIFKLHPIMLFESNHPRVLLTASHTVNGVESLDPNGSVFTGDWSPETQTLKLAPQAIRRIDAPFTPPQEDRQASKRTFGIRLSPDGTFEISHFLLADETRLSGRATIPSGKLVFR